MERRDFLASLAAPAVARANPTIYVTSEEVQAIRAVVVIGECPERPDGRPCVVRIAQLEECEGFVTQFNRYQKSVRGKMVAAIRDICWQLTDERASRAKGGVA